MVKFLVEVYTLDMLTLIIFVQEMHLAMLFSLYYCTTCNTLMIFAGNIGEIICLLSTVTSVFYFNSRDFSLTISFTHFSGKYWQNRISVHKGMVYKRIYYTKRLRLIDCCCLTPSGNYFMHIQDGNKLATINQYVDCNKATDKGGTFRLALEKLCAGWIGA